MYLALGVRGGWVPWAAERTPPSGGKEAGGRALTDQRFWGWGDESRSLCWADVEWNLA